MISCGACTFSPQAVEISVMSQLQVLLLVLVTVNVNMIRIVETADVKPLKSKSLLYSVPAFRTLKI